MLCRTRQKFRLLRRDHIKGQLRLIVQADGSNREGTLHHSCHVKPVLRASVGICKANADH
jgi:hypothetical protein